MWAADISVGLSCGYVPLGGGTGGGGLVSGYCAIIPWGLDTFLIFPSFLKSKFQVVRRLVWQLVCTMFIINTGASFQLW